MATGASARPRKPSSRRTAKAVLRVRDCAVPCEHGRRHPMPLRCEHRRRFRWTRNHALRDTKSAFGLTRKFQVPRQLAHRHPSAPPFRTVVAQKRGPRDAARPTLVLQPFGVRCPAAPCRNADDTQHSRLSWLRVAPSPLLSSACGQYVKRSGGAPAIGLFVQTAQRSFRVPPERRAFVSNCGG